MEKTRLEAIEQGFKLHQQELAARARKFGRIHAILDRIFPPLEIEPTGSGEPTISVYTGPLDGVDRMVRIVHNQQAGRPLDQGLLPEDSAA